MFFINLKGAWRNLLRYPFSSVINILGLVTGITCCIFIALYVWGEYQANTFHANKDHIFRAQMVSPDNGRAGASTSYPFGTSLQNEFPDVRKIARLGQDNVSVRVGEDAYFYETGFFWADSTFFQVFSFPVVKGNAATALNDPRSIVLTESMAARYFKDADPIGKTMDVKIYDGDRKITFTVTAVVQDLPRTSGVQFTFLAPMRTAMQLYPQFENFWNLSWVSTYALIDNVGVVPSIEQSAKAFYTKYAGESFSKAGLELQPLSDWRLYSGHVGHELTDGIVNIYVFIVTGALIFLLACVNYVNIYTARAELRKKEIGVRKALGAFRRQLFIQFMIESFLTAGIVMVLAFGIVSIVRPWVLGYIDNTAVLFSAFVLPVAFLAAMVLIGLVAGMYPAVVLSGFKALEALKAKGRAVKGSAINLRQALVVFQFTISIALIAGTFMIRKQVHYLKHADLGMATDQLIVIPVDDRELQKRMASIHDLMASTPGVETVSATGESFPAAMNFTAGLRWPEWQEGDENGISVVSVDADYFTVLDATFLEGRNLSSEFTSDDSSAVIINEAARVVLGGQSAVGREISIDGLRKTVVGVVKDIHHQSLHQKVAPVAYFPIPAPNRACSDNLVLKVNPANLPATLASLKQKWETLTDDRPFEYHFVNEEFQQAYAQEEKFLALFEVFSGLAIVIACLGLMGLSSFVVNTRAKEIGIRKVLGASVSQILFMLTGGFSIPIVIAFLISAPIVYYVMSGWLKNFAYGVGVDLLLIGVAGLLAWGIAFMFIGAQAWRAARVNPVKTLKDE